MLITVDKGKTILKDRTINTALILLMMCKNKINNLKALETLTPSPGIILIPLSAITNNKIKIILITKRVVLRTNLLLRTAHRR